MKDVRFRAQEYTKKVINEELYERWLLNNKEYSHVTYKMFKKYWENIASKMIQLTCTNSHGIKLPQHLGEMSLKYVTINNPTQDYLKSKIIQEDIPYINFETGGKVGKVVWSVLYARKLNSELPMLGFQACRKFTQSAFNSFKQVPELFRITKASKINVEGIIHKYKNLSI